MSATGPRENVCPLLYTLLCVVIKMDMCFPQDLLQTGQRGIALPMSASETRVTCAALCAMTTARKQAILGLLTLPTQLAVTVTRVGFVADQTCIHVRVYVHAGTWRIVCLQGTGCI